MNLKLTLNQMLLSNIHIGHTCRFLNVKIKPFLLGYRNDVHIINITYTSFQFKLVINFLINIFSLRQKLLIVRELDFFNFAKTLQFKNIFYYDKKWIGGCLTNFKRVRNNLKFKQLNNSKNSLTFLRYMPSAVFFFDVNQSKWALLESLNLDIPVISIVDTNTEFLNYINYPVVGNNQAFESLYLYLTLIKNSALKGKQKELFKILRIC